MHKDCSLLENDLTQLEETDLIDKVALILRNTILKMEKTKLPSKIKTNDLIAGECAIPDKLDRFFKVFIGGKDIRRRDSLNCNRLSSSMAADAIFAYVDTLNGKETLHDTVGIIYQNIDNNSQSELNQDDGNAENSSPTRPPQKENDL
ncbi:hypothetical protein HHI36_011270 [Cryptolaemus montrouzieri]|uniref:Uncharacterized protein n=1 Tax=Cryptolaemus montrouzieri TaxID=559131 RepID=A0ABD2MLB4_9CUCU